MDKNFTVGLALIILGDLKAQDAIGNEKMEDDLNLSRECNGQWKDRGWESKFDKLPTKLII